MLNKLRELLPNQRNSELYVFILIRIPLFLFPISFNEYYLNYILGQFFFNNDLPYCDILKPEYYVGEFGIVYVPVLYYYYIWSLAVISFNNMIIMAYITKAIWILFDFLVLISLRSFIMTHQGETLSKIICFLYSVSPTSYLIAGILGSEESLVLASIFTSFYFFYKEKYGVSSILLALGFSLKIFPVILLLIYLPYLMQNKDYKHCCIYLVSIIFTYILLCMPYISTCPSSLVEAHISMLRRPSGISFFPSEIESFLSINLFSLPFISLPITIKNLLSLFVLILLFTRIIVFKINKNDLIDYTILILATTPLMFWILHYRFFYYLTPFVLIKIVKPENMKMNKLLSKMRNLNTLHILFGFAFLIYYYYEFSDISSFSQGTLQYQKYFIIFAIYNVVWLVVTSQLKIYSSEVFNWYIYPIFFFGLSFYCAVFTIIGYPLSSLKILGIIFYIFGIIVLKKEYPSINQLERFNISNYFTRRN